MNNPQAEQQQEQFQTGAVRQNTVAGQDTPTHPLRYDLLLANTTLLRRLAATFGEGSNKYGDDNWRKGMPEKSLINHAIAHLMQHLTGDTTEDHLAHAVWNLGALMWMQENRPDMLDLSGMVQGPNLQACNSATPVPDTGLNRYLNKLEQRRVSMLSHRLYNSGAPFSKATCELIDRTMLEPANCQLIHLIQLESKCSSEGISIE